MIPDYVSSDGKVKAIFRLGAMNLSLSLMRPNGKKSEK